MLASYLLLSTAFFNGASGDPETVSPLPAAFVHNNEGHYTVTLAASGAFNMSLRELFPVQSGLIFDIEVDYRVLTGTVRVSPQVWKIDPSSPYSQQGGVTADGSGQTPGSLQTVKARFSASGGSTGATYPNAIGWTSGAQKLRPSVSIAETAGAAASVRIEGVRVNLVGITQTVSIPSSLDSYQQPAIYHKGDPAKPVIVSMHSWHGTYDAYDSFAATRDFAIANGWTFISPDFRGAANNATYQTLHAGSDHAIQDVLDARAWALADSGASASKVYIMGGSGGGYMALLVAAKNPTLFKAVASYVGITDLAAWHEWCVRRADQGLNVYSSSVAASLGGAPSSLPDAYAARSPLQWLDALDEMPVHIQHGILDQTVPLEHSIAAFNAVAEAKGLDVDQIVGEERAALINHGRFGQTLPSEITAQAGTQGSYTYALPFVRKTGDVEIVLEQAGHTGDPRIIFDFFQSLEAGEF